MLGLACARDDPLMASRGLWPLIALLAIEQILALWSLGYLRWGYATERERDLSPLRALAGRGDVCIRAHMDDVSRHLRFTAPWYLSLYLFQLRLLGALPFVGAWVLVLTPAIVQLLRWSHSFWKTTLHLNRKLRVAALAAYLLLGPGGAILLLMKLENLIPSIGFAIALAPLELLLISLLPQAIFLACRPPISH
jgi:hypothetical protein